MGNCLACAEKAGKNAVEVPVALKETPQHMVITGSMGVTASSDSHSHSRPPAAAQPSVYSGSGEVGDCAAADRNSRITPVSAHVKTSVLPPSGDHILDRHLGAFFDRYRDADVDCILADGIERFCADIHVQPDEFAVLVLAWKFNAEAMCRFTREEFISGCRVLGGADTPQAVQAQLPAIVAEVCENKDRFRDLYRWTYRFGLDVGQRTLPLSMALSLWRLVFSLNPPSVLERWLAFLEHRRSATSGIMRDTWDMYLLFTEVIGEDFERYDESEAWPSLIDDFVEYENDRRNHNVATGNGGEKHVVCER